MAANTPKRPFATDEQLASELRIIARQLEQDANGETQLELLQSTIRRDLAALARQLHRIAGILDQPAA